ncbi:MAG: hydroxyacid dehydrogenase, partial [Armatimonadota bacterium]|nr:hydroxyacid dehydrogenase [Armatimonadota bacterium]
MKGLFILDTNAYQNIYGPDEREAIARMVELVAPQRTREQVREDPAVLRTVEVVFSGWGGPRMDAAFLEAAPALKAVFYGAGSVRGIVTDAFWERGILITSAYAANAIPVAEYTLSQILFCLKQGWYYARAMREAKRKPPRVSVAGAYGSTVGIISLGMVGRRVCELLRPFDLKVLAYDPYVEESSAAQLGVTLCGLDEIFARADVVSLHTPWLPETEGMITGAHFSAMKPGAAFLNTARGAIVREAEMIAVLQQRPDIQVVLD